ncbi:hypothetical protein BCR43DRAFT_490912 [Syncephalastrum racemosum]|uniref:Histone chaperone RTT106/FACT complex subunit SPT16-like middle domain-containing protein n=1 Tax=Syncephalastrum racemosum TaxID=13706 RepID=A0A1X2HGV2_SYNRA|nr:hypothetical protein BCR43DRAFT_490912 [Syncephalastrum racemosum]
MSDWTVERIEDPQLRQSVEQLISNHPPAHKVIQDLALYYESKDERDPKKRKVTTATRESRGTAVATVPDLSFQSPRKKYNLVLTSTQIALHNPKTDETEHTFAVSDLTLAVCLPSPGVAKAHTFVLFFTQKELDPLVFNVPHKGDTVLKRPTGDTVLGEQDKIEALVKLLQTEARLNVITPDPRVYRSTGVSATTGKSIEGDKFYCDAYLKAKEGFLYFLPGGILYGFKKPTLYFPFSQIASTSFCSITQRTFDLAIVLKEDGAPLGPASAVGSEIQFSMIEQSEFGGIERYLQDSQINDQSMSEENKEPEIRAKHENDSQNENTNQNENQIDEDDDEENDDDFQPSDRDEDPLEYDTDADSEEEVEEEEEDTHAMDEDHEEQEQEEQVSAATGTAQADENDGDAIEEGMEGEDEAEEAEEEEEGEEEEELESEDEGSVSLGSSEGSQTPAHHPQHASPLRPQEEEKDELDDSD